MNISITDYGVGNLYSIRRSLESCGANVKVLEDMKDLRDAECIVFPGVGAFDATMKKLLPMREEICDMLKNGTPALGICIGMQILYEGSDEGTSPGLGLYKGRVEKLPCKMIPHMGWNQVRSEDPLLEGIPDNNFYFVHSYYGNPKEDGITLGTTEYEGVELPSFFRKYNTYGTQFHPEKSSSSGRKVLQNFISFAEGQL
ncbi:MAG: imidazole glycerol phosphate synthase subunit HisH [Candidatus Methanomethylophilaceae archaeon]|nr:imidazole glycerol phosphate synthase subunit HisH [Candidatus Methanomethylophilaceae archaeon]